MGDSPAFYWRDVASFQDIWTAWYTDVEPESCFVAEAAGRVVGYLSGCVDSRRAPSPRDAVTRQMLRRLLVFRPGTSGFFWRSMIDVLREGSPPSGEVDDPRWPAHLHTNLLSEGRGLGLGRALMEAWFERLRNLAVPGCHLGTLAENTRGIAFFERMGFRRLGTPQRVPGMRTPEGARMHQQLMVIDLVERALS